jgi:hypothetical protein
MKKLAIGCGILLVVLLVGGAVATHFIYKKVKSTVAEFSALGEIPAIERTVRNSATFSPPESGELTQAQVARFVKVQEQVRALLGSRFDEFKTKYAELSKRMDKGEGTVFDATAVLGAYKDLARTYLDAKKAQVDALNASNFSLSEYHWVRQQAYAAIGMPVMDVDVSKIVNEITSGQPPTEQHAPHVGGAIGPSGPEVNKTLVAPHKKTLEDNAALSFFGL